ncbi:hypothetical protein PUN28_004115 [Cardiocondyla obscurior]|uniref:Uncharacterized protein n=1 Tax=Cardiocondyla obscurior TaxID=286306 RepID=A0AAW2GPM6_9HYME
MKNSRECLKCEFNSLVRMISRDCKSNCIIELGPHWLVFGTPDESSDTRERFSRRNFESVGRGVVSPPGSPSLVCVSLHHRVLGWRRRRALPSPTEAAEVSTRLFVQVRAPGMCGFHSSLH